MKSFSLFTLIVIFTLSMTAQQEHLEARNRDRVLADFSFTGWSHDVSDLKTKWYSRGVGLHYIHNFEISERFDFGLGVGIKNSNFYHRSNLVEITHPDTTLEAGSTFSTFTPIDSNAGVERNKLSLSYFSFPLEFRYIGKPGKKNKAFKFALGVHANYRMNVHTKRVDATGKYKDFNFNNLEKWTFGAHTRIGYHRTALQLETSFNSIFKKNFGPTMLPFRIGFVYTLLD